MPRQDVTRPPERSNPTSLGSRMKPKQYRHVTQRDIQKMHSRNVRPIDKNRGDGAGAPLPSSTLIASYGRPAALGCRICSVPKVRQTKTRRIYPSLSRQRRVCPANTTLFYGLWSEERRNAFSKERHAPRVQSGEEDWRIIRPTTALQQRCTCAWRWSRA